MSEELPPEDPFVEGDPEAAERERRRQEREARRKARDDRRRSEGSRRSLADRVSGALGGAGAAAGAEGEDDSSAAERPPADPQPEPPPRPALEPSPQQEPTPQPPQPPPAREPDPVPYVEPVGPRASRDVDEQPDIGDRDRPVATPREPGQSTGVHGLIERIRSGGHGGSPQDRSVVVRRRLFAGGAVLAVLAVIVLLVKAVGGGEEPPPVAEVKPVKTTDVLVPEGLTIDQIADVAKKAKLKGSYEKAVEQAQKNFPLKKYGAEDADSLEGFLFPATYELEQGAAAKDLVAKQLEAFEQNFGSVNTKKAQKKNLSDYDVVTIASLIEKEIQVAEERPLAAAVIYNRLKAGDTLGIDATLRYELENYDEQLLQSELDAPTPYNTRITPGLPPTPIANPGLASLEAAANPENSDVYYFVVKPGTCGEHVFTADAAEFDAASAEYQAALAEEGGSPTDCG